MPRVDDHANRAQARMIGVVCVVLACLAAVMVIHAAVVSHNLSQQRALQSKLADPDLTDNTQIASAATQLISGKLSGKYNFTDKLLAQYYLEGAAAYDNLKQYSKAIAYYKAAPKYDSTTQLAALQGEANSGYSAGERTQLIPILTNLESLVANIHNPEEPTSAQYQSDIAAIQHNQPAVNL